MGYPSFWDITASYLVGDFRERERERERERWLKQREDKVVVGHCRRLREALINNLLALKPNLSIARRFVIFDSQARIRGES